MIIRKYRAADGHKWMVDLNLGGRRLRIRDFNTKRMAELALGIFLFRALSEISNEDEEFFEGLECADYM